MKRGAPVRRSPTVSIASTHRPSSPARVRGGGDVFAGADGVAGVDRGDQVVDSAGGACGPGDRWGAVGPRDGVLAGEELAEANAAS